MLTQPVPVLDHGYVTVVETWGSDERVIEAARMSTAKGFQGWGGASCPECLAEHRLSDRDGLFRTIDAQHDAHNCKTCKGAGVTIGDEKLLRYLWTHKHYTPFEMAGLVIEVQAPIFVFREWHRHRTQSYNELSARYTPLPDVNYVPSVERLLMRDEHNKQAQSTGAALDENAARSFQAILNGAYSNAQNGYEGGLAMGVPKELARLLIPVGRYSRMRAAMNLRNCLAFLTLRLDPAAQWEIRQYAQVVGRIVEAAFPRTWTLFAERETRTS